MQDCCIHSLKTSGKMKVFRVSGLTELLLKFQKRITYDNWRGICVLHVVAKIISKIILEQHLCSAIDAEQSRTDHMNTIRILIEKYVEHRADLNMVFIDFGKAFDSIHRSCIWTVLQNRVVPETIICSSDFRGCQTSRTQQI